MSELIRTVDLGEFACVADVERAAAQARSGGDRERELELLSMAAESHLEDGEPGRAVTLYRQLATELADEHGADDEDALAMRGSLGRALTEARLYREAEDVLAQLLVDRERVLGPDDPQTLTTRGNLARAVGRGGRPDEAILMAEALLADRLRLLGPDHPSTLDTRGHVAQFHMSAGRAQLAADLFTELLVDRRRVLDSDDHVLASTEHNLAAAVADGNTAEGALAALYRNVVRQTERFGAEHPGTLVARALVAAHLRALGRHRDAIEVLEALLKDRMRLLGELSPAAMETHCLLAASTMEVGRVDEAVVRLSALCHAAKATLGPRQVDTIQSREFLIAALFAAGDENQAIDELMQLEPDTADLETTNPLRVWIETMMDLWVEVECDDE